MKRDVSVFDLFAFKFCKTIEAESDERSKLIKSQSTEKKKAYRPSVIDAKIMSKPSFRFFSATYEICHSEVNKRITPETIHTLTKHKKFALAMFCQNDRSITFKSPNNLTPCLRFSAT